MTKSTFPPSGSVSVDGIEVVELSDIAPQPITVTLSLGIAELEQGMNEQLFLNKTEALIRKSIKLGGNWLSEAL